MITEHSEKIRMNSGLREGPKTSVRYPLISESSPLISDSELHILLELQIGLFEIIKTSSRSRKNEVIYNVSWNTLVYH
jgi:hypothetical protein